MSPICQGSPLCSNWNDFYEGMSRITHTLASHERHGVSSHRQINCNKGRLPCFVVTMHSCTCEYFVQLLDWNLLLQHADWPKSLEYFLYCSFLNWLCDFYGKCASICTGLKIYKLRSGITNASQQANLRVIIILSTLVWLKVAKLLKSLDFEQIMLYFV